MIFPVILSKTCLKPYICKSAGLGLNLSSLNLLLSSSSTTSRELLSQFSTCSGWKMTLKCVKNCQVGLLVSQSHGNFHSKTPSCEKIKAVFRDVKWCFNASWGLKGLECRNCHFVKFQIRPANARWRFAVIPWLGNHVSMSCQGLWSNKLQHKLGWFL